MSNRALSQDITASPYGGFTEQFRRTTKLALPLVAAQLAQMGLEVIDNIMIGHIGVKELASAALSGPAYFTLLVFFIGILTAVGITLSREHGAKRYHDLASYLQQGIILAMLCVVPAMLLVFALPSLLLTTGQQPELVALSTQYLHSVVWSVPPIFLYIALREYLTAMQLPRVVVWISLVALPFDVLFNYWFIYGYGPVPALGIAGAGWSTVLISWSMLAALVWYIFKHQDLSEHIQKIFPLRFLRSKVMAMFRLGWPIGVTLVFEVGLFSVTSNMMGHFGHIALAAHQIAMQASSITFMFYLGTAQATAIRVSHALGAEQEKSLVAIGHSGVACALIFAVLVAGLFVAVPEFIAHLFLNENEPEKAQVITHATQFLAIAALFQFSDALQVVMNSALRGLKDTLIPMFLGLGTYWLIGITIGAWLGFMSPVGPSGLWWGLLCGLTASGLVLATRYYRKAHHLYLAH